MGRPYPSADLFQQKFDVNQSGVSHLGSGKGSIPWSAAIPEAIHIKGSPGLFAINLEYSIVGVKRIIFSHWEGKMLFKGNPFEFSNILFEEFLIHRICHKFPGCTININKLMEVYAQ